MTTEELLKQIKRFIDLANVESYFNRAVPQVRQFLRTYGGSGNAFSLALETSSLWDPDMLGPSHETVRNALEAFYDYVAAGLASDTTPERQAQLDVVSDFLEMAGKLLQDKKVHPAAAAVLIGATLEEFLRTWIENENISLGNRKPGLENYSTILREKELITKQDGKDITGWAGIRNDAAHGHWENIGGHASILLMLQGVNLFLQKHNR